MGIRSEGLFFCSSARVKNAIARTSKIENKKGRNLGTDDSGIYILLAVKTILKAETKQHRNTRQRKFLENSIPLEPPRGHDF